MSISQLDEPILRKESSVYDEKGRTAMPNDIMQALSVDKGDTIIYDVLSSGEVKLSKK